MKYLISVILLLSACGGAPAKPQSQLVTKDHYIVREVPAEYFVIPAQVPAVDWNTATQQTVAEWIIMSDERTNKLELQMTQALKVQEENVANANKK